MSDDSYLPAENRRQNGACTEMRTTVFSGNINNDVLLSGKISKKSYATHNDIYFMRRKINASDGTVGTDDDDFMRRNLTRQRKVFCCFISVL